MRRAADGGMHGGRKKLPVSLGFKCAYCGGEFGSRAGMDSHRRHRISIGTPCADPMNSKSMSLTQRGDTYTGTLRLHDTLGVCAYMHCCPYCRLFRQHYATQHVIICISWHNVNNSVLIVHMVKQSVLFLSGNPCQKIYYSTIIGVMTWLLQPVIICYKVSPVINGIKFQ